MPQRRLEWKCEACDIRPFTCRTKEHLFIHRPLLFATFYILTPPPPPSFRSPTPLSDIDIASFAYTALLVTNDTRKHGV